MKRRSIHAPDLLLSIHRTRPVGLLFEDVELIRQHLHESTTPEQDLARTYIYFRVKGNEWSLRPLLHAPGFLCCLLSGICAPCGIIPPMVRSESLYQTSLAMWNAGVDASKVIKVLKAPLPSLAGMGCGGYIAQEDILSRVDVLHYLLRENGLFFGLKDQVSVPAFKGSVMSQVSSIDSFEGMERAIINLKRPRETERFFVDTWAYHEMATWDKSGILARKEDYVAQLKEWADSNPDDYFAPNIGVKRDGGKIQVNPVSVILNYRLLLPSGHPFASTLNSICEQTDLTNFAWSKLEHFSGRVRKPLRAPQKLDKETAKLVGYVLPILLLRELLLLKMHAVGVATENVRVFEQTQTTATQGVGNTVNINQHTATWHVLDRAILRDMDDIGPSNELLQLCLDYHCSLDPADTARPATHDAAAHVVVTPE